MLHGVNNATNSRGQGGGSRVFTGPDETRLSPHVHRSRRVPEAWLVIMRVRLCLFAVHLCRKRQHIAGLQVNNRTIVATRPQRYPALGDTARCME